MTQKVSGEDTNLKKVIQTTDSKSSQLETGEINSPAVKETNSGLSFDSRQQKTVFRWLSGGRGLLIGLGIGVVLTVAGTRVLSTSSRPTQNPVTPISPVASSQVAAQSVTVAEVQTSEINRSLKATGTVAAVEMVPVLSQATGLQIRKILVDEGEFVKAGQLMAVLDDSNLLAQLAQAQASVAQAEARLAELLAGTRSEEIAQARENVKIAAAEIIRAESELDLARKRVQRNQNLEVEGAIASDRLDEFLNQERVKRSNLQQAQARWREAKQRLTQLEAGPRPEVIAQARAQLAQARAQMRLVMEQLEDTRVKAPVSGKIAERNARVGNTTTSFSQTPLFQIIEDGRLELRVKVPETQLALIRVGQKVLIASDIDRSLKLSGKVREINPVIDESSRQATVKVELGDRSSLKPGMFLEAAIVTSNSSGLTLPMAAVLPQANESAIVYLLQQNNIVKAQGVEIGEILPNRKVEIISGLQLGDRVVVKGAPYLKDGDRVEIR